MLPELMIIVSILALDQASKALAVHYLTALPGNTYPLWQGVLHLAYVENRGAAFGVLQNARWFFLIVTAFAVAAIVWFLLRHRGKLHPLMRISLALILAGALGNCIDRVVLGYVRDMIYVACIDFAVFNVADSAVCVGTALLILDLLFGKGKAFLKEDAPKQKTPEKPTGQNGEKQAEEGH